ncbi:hypothetical protein FQZ97_454240 [compost metagenome]
MPLLQPGEDEILIVLAHRQAGAPGAGQAVQGEQLVVARQAPRLVPARAGLGRLAARRQQAGLVMEHPGQGGAVHHVEGDQLRLLEALRRLLQLILLQAHQALAEVLVQIVEAGRGAGRHRLVEAEEALVGLWQLAARQFDLPQQQVQAVGVAAKAQGFQHGQGLAGIDLGFRQATQGEQAAGAIEQQHGTGRVALRVALQRAVDQVDAVHQIAAEHRQAAAQEPQRLLRALRAVRADVRLAQQALQAQQADLCASDVVGGDHRAGFGDRQGVVIGALAWHAGEEVDDGVDLALAQQVETVPFDRGEQFVVGARAAELVDRLGVAVVLEQPAGGLEMQAQQGLRGIPPQALIGGVAQRRMVAVGQALAAALEEQVLGLQLAQQLRGVARAAEAGRQLGVEAADHRGALDEAQQPRRQLAQDVLLEKAGDIVAGQLRRAPQGRPRLLGIGSQPEQHPADPAFAAGAQPVDGIAVQVQAAGGGQLADLRAVHGQVGRLQQLQALVAAQLAGRQAWQALAGGQQVQGGRGEAQQFVEVAARLARAQQVQVVEDQGEAFALLFQAFDDGGPQPGGVGGRQRRAVQRQAQGLAQVQQQMQRLVVVGLAAQPGPGRVQAGGVLGEQGALAVAERRAEQAEQAAALGRLVHLLQQLRPGNGRGRHGRRPQLVELERQAIHRQRRPAAGDQRGRRPKQQVRWLSGWA